MHKICHFRSLCLSLVTWKYIYLLSMKQQGIISWIKEKFPCTLINVCKKKRSQNDLTYSEFPSNSSIGGIRITDWYIDRLKWNWQPIWHMQLASCKILAPSLTAMFMIYKLVTLTWKINPVLAILSDGN